MDKIPAILLTLTVLVVIIGVPLGFAWLAWRKSSDDCPRQVPDRDPDEIAAMAEFGLIHGEGK